VNETRTATDLGSATAEDVVGADCLLRYRQLQEIVNAKLVRLNAITTLIGQLYKPRKFGTAGPPNAFFAFFSSTTFHYGIILAHRLWNDQSADVVTLKTLRNYVVTNSRPMWTPALREALRRVRLSPEEQKTLKRIAGLRNRVLAHTQDPRHFDPDRAAGQVSAMDLRQVAEQFGRIYNAVNIGAESLFVPVNFWDDQSELEYILDLVTAAARESTIFDDEPGYWRRHVRPKLSRADLIELNRAREIAGKPPLPLD